MQSRELKEGEGAEKIEEKNVVRWNELLTQGGAGVDFLEELRKSYEERWRDMPFGRVMIDVIGPVHPPDAYGMSVAFPFSTRDPIAPIRNQRTPEP